MSRGSVSSPGFAARSGGGSLSLLLSPTSFLVKTKTALISLLLPLTAVAQSYVSPAFYTNAEGLSNNVFPFGNTTVPFRYSQVHDDVPTMVVSGFKFRHNAATVTYPAHSVTIDGWMSTAVSVSTAATSTFDNNHGLDKQQIVTNRTYNHPASDSTNVPGQFLLDYPFDVPFFYVSTNGSLCWEVIVTAKTQTTSVTHDSAAGAVANPTLQVSRGGTGCLATGRASVMSATGSSTMSWTGGTGTLTLTGTNAAASAPVFHALGFDKNFWAGAIPLPFVVPGSTGAASGTCNVYTDILFTMGTTASATGSVTSSVPIPASPIFHGAALYSQWLCLDQAANPTGIVTSPLVVHGVSAPNAVSPACRIFLSGSTGATGSIAQSSMLVTNFY